MQAKKRKELLKTIMQARTKPDESMSGSGASKRAHGSRTPSTATPSCKTPDPKHVKHATPTKLVFGDEGSSD